MHIKQFAAVIAIFASAAVCAAETSKDESTQHTGRVVAMQSTSDRLYIQFSDGKCGWLDNNSPEMKSRIRSSRMSKSNITLGLKELQDCDSLAQLSGQK